MDLIPATADCSQEGPVHIITTVPLPPRNTRDNLEALAEAPTTPRAPETSRQAIKTDADLDARTSHTALPPPRNTRDNLEAPAEAPTTPRAPETSRQAIKTDADLDARTSHTALLPLRNTRNDPEAPPTASKAAARIKANAVTGTDERITPQTE